MFRFAKAHFPFEKYLVVMLVLIILCLQLAKPNYAVAQTVGASGLPLPRFVSLKSTRVNMRVGPGRDYHVQWLYVRKGLPMEVIQEFGHWRKVRDPIGVEGWILHSLLSGSRAAIVTPWDVPTKEQSETVDLNRKLLPTTNMYAAASKNSDIIARIEAGSLAEIDNCHDNWCKLNVESEKNAEISGYVLQILLWGVYPDEMVNN